MIEETAIGKEEAEVPFVEVFTYFQGWRLWTSELNTEGELRLASPFVHEGQVVLWPPRKYLEAQCFQPRLFQEIPPHKTPHPFGVCGCGIWAFWRVRDIELVEFNFVPLVLGRAALKGLFVEYHDGILAREALPLELYILPEMVDSVALLGGTYNVPLRSIEDLVLEDRLDQLHVGWFIKKQRQLLREKF